MAASSLVACSLLVGGAASGRPIRGEVRWAASDAAASTPGSWRRRGHEKEIVNKKSSSVWLFFSAAVDNRLRRAVSLFSWRFLLRERSSAGHHPVAPAASIGMRRRHVAWLTDPLLDFGLIPTARLGRFTGRKLGRRAKRATSIPHCSSQVTSTHWFADLGLRGCSCGKKGKNDFRNNLFRLPLLLTY